MHRILMIGSLSAVAISLLWTFSNGQDEPADEVRELMRQKLAHTQKVLEGTTSEDYEMVLEHAAELRRLTGEKEWKVLPTVEYSQLSMEFLRSVESLEAAAKAKNQDAVDLGYLNLTMKCMYCHKYVKTTREARLQFDRLLRRR
jgi:hypothetical protein